MSLFTGKVTCFSLIIDSISFCPFSLKDASFRFPWHLIYCYFCSFCLWLIDHCHCWCSEARNWINTSLQVLPSYLTDSDLRGRPTSLFRATRKEEFYQHLKSSRQNQLVEAVHKKNNRTHRHTLFFTIMIMCSRVCPSLLRFSSLRLLCTAAPRTVVVKPSDHLSASLAFEDPSAFRVKSWGELLRTLGIFHFCSFPVLVNNCGKVRVEFSSHQPLLWDEKGMDRAVLYLS